MYNDIKLEKGLYNITSKSFTEVLEDLDNGENYKNTELASLDAFERQLKRFNIKVSGTDSDLVEKFFQSTQSAVLFPEFVRRCIKQGMDDVSILPSIVAAVTRINSVDYRGIQISNTNVTSSTEDGASLPEFTIKLSDSSIRLAKYGSKISASYESIRGQRLEVIAVALRNIGAAVSRCINTAAVNVLTENVTETLINTDSITYNDLVAFWSSDNKYNTDTFIASPAAMASIIKMDDVNSCTINDNAVTLPFGAKLIKSNALTGSRVIALDSSTALEMINGSDVVIDFDKLISTQMENTSFSITVGFAKILGDSVRCFASH